MISVTDVIHGQTDSLSYAEYKTRRGSRKIIIRRAILLSVSTGFHDTPKTGQLIPVRRLSNSVNLIAGLHCILEEFIKIIIENGDGMSLLTKSFASVAMVFIISMTPVLELRGAIPYGFAAGLSAWVTIAVSVVGNMILVPFIILSVRSVFEWLKKMKFMRRFVEWSENHVMKNKKIISKYEALGLMILVAIPLPGTGAWTGAMLAGLLGMRLKESLPAIFIGVIVAAIIVTLVSYGFIGAIGLFGL